MFASQSENSCTCARVTGIPFDTTQMALHGYLAQFADIVSMWVNLRQNEDDPGGKSRLFTGTGFVQFRTPEGLGDAMAAVPYSDSRVLSSRACYLELQPTRNEFVLEELLPTSGFEKVGAPQQEAQQQPTQQSTQKRMHSSEDTDRWE